MKELLLAGLVVLGAGGAMAREPGSNELPVTVGTCGQPTIASVGSRLVDGRTGKDMPGMGHSVRYSNGGVSVSYGADVSSKAIDGSRVGDRVLVCLVFIPQGCPAGDVRGRIYTVTNFRTMESWTLPDSAHRCGGA